MRRDCTRKRAENSFRANGDQVERYCMRLTSMTKRGLRCVTYGFAQFSWYQASKGEGCVFVHSRTSFVCMLFKSFCNILHECCVLDWTTSQRYTKRPSERSNKATETRYGPQKVSITERFKWRKIKINVVIIPNILVENSVRRACPWTSNTCIAKIRRTVLLICVCDGVGITLSLSRRCGRHFVFF